MKELEHFYKELIKSYKENYKTDSNLQILVIILSCKINSIHNYSSHKIINFRHYK